jgi:site-specific recombinase XerD
MIKKYLKTRRHDSEWLFCNERGGGKMQRENAAKKFRELRGLAGLEEKRVTAHTMRHTFATQAGKTAPIQVVQQMLRHSKLETTMIYVETSQDDVKAYHAKAI